MKKFLILIVIFILNLSLAIAEDIEVLPSQIGLVTNVEYVDLNDNLAQVKQVAKIKLLGKTPEQEIIVNNVLTGNPYYDINLRKGLKVILHVEKDQEDLIFSVEDIYRSNVLAFLSFVFCGLLIAVGKRKGINSLISIAITCLLIVSMLSPMILAGINPIFSTIIVCLLSTAITMYLVGGFNRKSTSATIGCLLSLILAGGLSVSTARIASLTGFSSEHSIFLFSAHPELDFLSIAVSTMILATMGAVMDVAMSIASTINEIYFIDNSKSVKELFLSGMNVGRDIIGTMANTLILVYLGASLPMILLASNIDVLKFINLNQVVTEISSALIGSCAIIICVPITAFISSGLIKKTPNKVDFSQLQD